VSKSQWAEVHDVSDLQSRYREMTPKPPKTEVDVYEIAEHVVIKATNFELEMDGCRAKSIKLDGHDLGKITRLVLTVTVEDVPRLEIERLVI
jgi:hypothetical protein